MQHTIRLYVKDSAYEKLLKLLESFSKDEIEILTDNQDFLSEQQYLEKELDEIKSGDTSFLSQEEMEYRLNSLAHKYENHL